MRSISAYRKMFGVASSIDLKELKTTYRKLVKEWHPDKFQDEEKKAEAEFKSQEIIDGYHFLVSIAEETKQAGLEDYNKRTSTIGIADFKYEKSILKITFNDDSVYEYFGVTPKLFQKMLNTDKVMRFSKRNIFTSFLYRQSKKATVKSEETKV